MDWSDPPPEEEPPVPVLVEVVVAAALDELALVELCMAVLVVATVEDAFDEVAAAEDEEGDEISVMIDEAAFVELSAPTFTEPLIAALVAEDELAEDELAAADDAAARTDEECTARHDLRVLFRGSVVPAAARAWWRRCCEKDTPCPGAWKSAATAATREERMTMEGVIRML
jgi:hypothetical protein